MGYPYIGQIRPGLFRVYFSIVPHQVGLYTVHYTKIIGLAAVEIGVWRVPVQISGQRQPPGCFPALFI